MDKEEIGRIIEEIEKPQASEPWWQGPAKWIIAAFLLLIVIMWAVPYYGIELDPSPSSIISYDEAVPKGIQAENASISSYSEIRKVMMPNNDIIKEVADRISQAGCMQSSVCNAKAIFQFTKINFNYIADPTAYEYIKSPLQTLKVKAGDCDDASVLLANLLEAVGIRSRFVFVPGHVFVQAYMPEAINRYKRDGWVSLDVTCSYCGFGEEAIEYRDAKRSYIEA